MTRFICSAWIMLGDCIALGLMNLVMRCSCSICDFIWQKYPGSSLQQIFAVKQSSSLCVLVRICL